jgi:hypothetical protein
MPDAARRAVRRRAGAGSYRGRVAVPRSAALLVVSVLVPGALLTGCATAQDAVTSATQDAKRQAEQTAQDLARRALTAEACRLTEDGTLSAADVKELSHQLDAARGAGVPAQVIDQVRPLLAKAGGASRAQVKALRSSYCS